MGATWFLGGLGLVSVRLLRSRHLKECDVIVPAGGPDLVPLIVPRAFFGIRAAIGVTCDLFIVLSVVSQEHYKVIKAPVAHC